MKKYVERYIYDVTRRLPKEMQEDVEKELNAHIYDMLSETPTEEEINEVLHELGSPRVIANNYKENKRYVISPLYYDDYIRVLKLVMIIALTISLVISSIEAILHTNEATIFETIFSIFGSIINDLGSTFVSIFFIVTIIFWLIDRYHLNANLNEWKVKDLPDLPEVRSSKISRTQSIIGLIFSTIFSVIFIVILLRYIDDIGWYENGVLIAQLLDKNITDQFIVFFIISAIIGFAVQLLKIYYKKWNPQLAAAYTAHTILSVIIGLVFINQSGLITMEFLTKLANTMENSVDYLKDGIKNGVVWISVIVSVLTAIDILSTWLKTLKPKPLNK
jgi:HAAS domain-containing protein